MGFLDSRLAQGDARREHASGVPYSPAADPFSHRMRISACVFVVFAGKARSEAQPPLNPSAPSFFA
jgi:hypothetical protein